MGNSKQVGLTLRGFKEFMASYLSDYLDGEDLMLGWLENLGYDTDLNSIRSRNFVMTFHSNNPLDISSKDATQTDLDNRSNVLINEKFGVEATTTF